MMQTVAVWGLGITGRAVAQALLQRDVEVVAIDDRPNDAVHAWASAHDLAIHTPTDAELAALLDDVDAAVPAPGLPEAHRLFAYASTTGLSIFSEFDLAQRWDDRPIVAVTATDGKTTVVMMVEHMLNASGKRSLAVGNTDVPLVTAIDDTSFDVFVVEASSFRLGHSKGFAPGVAAWLNFGPDHLDNHASLARYETCKASMWSQLEPGSTAIANRQDPVVMRHASTLPDHVIVETFGDDVAGTHGVNGDFLFWHGEPLVEIASLSRRLPHDVLNTLAAGAAALAAGADRSAVKAVAETFVGLPHRVESIAEIDGVHFVNDSKATTPHATEAAIAGFASVVLIAGGRNKGLDLTGMAGQASRIRHVVAIGDDAQVIVDAFAGRTPTTTAASMEDAVQQARSIAVDGDTVLLSPACASFDWYSSYRKRGEHFTAIVHSIASGAVTSVSDSETISEGETER